MKRKMIQFALTLALIVCVQTNSQAQEATTELPDSVLFVPKVVTPDSEDYGDGAFSPIFTSPITDYELSVYNRWGEQIFKSDEENKAWYPNDVPDGTYFWVIEGSLEEIGIPQKFKETGNVTVIK